MEKKMVERERMRSVRKVGWPSVKKTCIGAKREFMSDGALGYVREGKVGEDAVDAFGGVDAEGRLHGFSHEAEGAEGLHRSLGLAGGAGGVDDGGEIVGVADRAGFERRLSGDDVRPEQAAGRCVGCGAVGEDDAGEVVEDVFVERKRVVELAGEVRDGLAVAEECGQGQVARGGEEGYADVAGHPDGEVGHDPPGAVFADDSDVGAGGPSLGFDP